MIKILEPKYLLYSLLSAVCVWAGATVTWIHPLYYGPSFLSLAMFLAFIGSFILLEIISNRSEITGSENVADKNLYSIKTAIILSIVLFVISLIITLSINLYVLTALVIVSGLILLLSIGILNSSLLKYIIMAVITGIVVISGGLAVEPKFVLTLPGPILPALFTMIFLIINVIISDIRKIEQDSEGNIRTLPDIIGIPKSLITIIVLFIIFVVITLSAVLAGWFGSAFKIITVYIIDLPIMVLLIFIWGNPNKRMLAIGSIAFKIGWILSIIAVLII